MDRSKKFRLALIKITKSPYQLGAKNDLKGSLALIKITKSPYPGSIGNKDVTGLALIKITKSPYHHVYTRAKKLV